MDKRVKRVQGKFAINANLNIGEGGAKPINQKNPLTTIESSYSMRLKYCS